MEIQTEDISRDGAPYARYVAHLRAGELAYQFSPVAERAVFFPRVRCPYSGQDCIEWRLNAGLGTADSTPVVHTRKADPYYGALIDLDAGFRQISSVVADDPMQVSIGQRVRFQAAAQEGLDDPIPVFVSLESRQ